MELYTFYSDTIEAETIIRDGYVNGKFIRENYSILILGLSGRANFIYDGEVQDLQKNTCIYITAGVPFVIKNRNPEYRSIISFFPDESIDEAHFGDVIYHLKRLAYRPRVFYLDDDMASICHYLVLRATESSLSTLPFKEDIAACYIKILMFTAFRLNISQSQQGRDSRRNILTDRFIEYARAHFRETRQMKDYADMLHVTPKYLSSCVLQATGRHASEWIDDFAIHDIKNRIKEGTETMQQISFDLNFATPSHLSHFFKARTGLTPREYLKIYRNNLTPPTRKIKCRPHCGG